MEDHERSQVCEVVEDVKHQGLTNQQLVAVALGLIQDALMLTDYPNEALAVMLGGARA